MKDIIQKILREENIPKTHILTNKLPVELDNRLYVLSHLIGGINFRDILSFASTATKEQIEELYSKVLSFPSEKHEILPQAGSFSEILDSEKYQDIVKLVKFSKQDEFINEQVEDSYTPGLSGSVTQDSSELSLRYGDNDPSGDMYFSEYVKPELKNVIFKEWDRLGKADYATLKLLGVEEDPGMEGVTDFRNVGDIVYPLLVIEWSGGVENTKFAKAPWKSTNEMGFENLKFKVEPVGFDYLYDESVDFGEHGYACWDIRVLIDKDGDLVTSEPPSDWDEPFMQSLFPESARNKLSSFRNYNDDQFETIEALWEYYHEEASELSSQFCRVEVVLV